MGNKVEAILDPRPDPVKAKEEAISKIVHQPPRTSTHGRRHRAKGNSAVCVEGADHDLLVRLAHCCNPVAGDDIVGFITRGRGVWCIAPTAPTSRGSWSIPSA